MIMEMSTNSIQSGHSHFPCEECYCFKF